MWWPLVRSSAIQLEYGVGEPKVIEVIVKLDLDVVLGASELIYSLMQVTCQGLDYFSNFSKVLQNKV